MGDLRHDGICLKSVDYKDYDQLITIYAFTRGKITVSAKGVKRPNAKLRYAASPFCFGRYEMSSKGKFITLTGCELIDSFQALWTDIDGFYCGSCALELLDKFCMEGDQNDALAACVLEYLHELAYSGQDALELLLKFLSRFLRLAGYDINLDNCTICGAQTGEQLYFSPAYGGVVFDCCSRDGDMEMSTEGYIVLRDIFIRNAIARDTKKEPLIAALNYLYAYISYVLESKVKSIEQYIAFILGNCQFLA